MATPAEQAEAEKLAQLTAADITVPASADVTDAAAVLEEYGAVIVDRLLSGEQMAVVDAEITRCQQVEARRAGGGGDDDDGEDLSAVYQRRLGAELLVAAPAVRQLLTQPMVTGIARELLGRHSKRQQLKLLEAVSA
jgi:hypothetical protein